MKLLFEPTDHERYLAGLNDCFPGWGDRAMYDWCFARTAGGPAPERMVFTDDDNEWVAGTGISFRTMRANGKRWLAGVMTGSWTLPAARGKGLFPAFIQETRRRVAHHGGVAVLGFAGDVQRASTRKLADAGSRCVPSTNAIGEAGDGDVTLATALHEHAATSADAASLYARWKARSEVRGGFAYDDLADFDGQLLRRALPLDIVQGPDDAIAVVERSPDTDRILFLDEGASDRADLLRALHGRATSRGRKLYAYGVGETAAHLYLRARLSPKAGFFTILPASESPSDAAVCDELARVDWDYQSGDRM
jgi:hypothetical protein